jgi:hypothetical protein
MKIARLDKRAYDLLADWRARGSKAWDSGFLGLIVRLLPWFEAESVGYFFHYSLAIRLHGGECGQDVSLTVTPAGWRRLCETQGNGFVARPDGSNGLLSVPGLGYGSTVKFVDSVEPLRTSVYGVWVASLPHLIGNFLSRPSDVTERYVVSLIRANDLGESFRTSLPADCRRRYLDCLRLARRGA